MKKLRYHLYNFWRAYFPTARQAIGLWRRAEPHAKRSR